MGVEMEKRGELGVSKSIHTQVSSQPNVVKTVNQKARNSEFPSGSRLCVRSSSSGNTSSPVWSSHLPLRRGKQKPDPAAHLLDVAEGILQLQS